MVTIAKKDNASKMDKLVVVGRGNVGKALSGAAKDAGWQAELLPARTFPSGKKLAGVVLIAVPDSHIEEVRDKIVARSTIAPRTTLAHCSGALPSNILRTSKTGAEDVYDVGSFHPLQTFPSPAAGKRDLPKAYSFVEGDPQAVKRLLHLGKSLTFKSMKIEGAEKTFYHAAAVIACNFLCCLADAALDCAHAAGLSPKVAAEKLKGIMIEAIDEVSTKQALRALGGPIAKGDLETVRAQLQTLQNSRPELLEMYVVLGRMSAQMRLKTEKRTALFKLFEEFSGLEVTNKPRRGHSPVAKHVSSLTTEGGGMANVAAVIASNFTCLLLHCALRCAKTAGIPEDVAKAALSPLIYTTVNNAFNFGPQDSITGPIARGDLETVEAHLKSINADKPEMLKMYLVMGKLNADLARRGGSISRDCHRQTLELLARY